MTYLVQIGYDQQERRYYVLASDIPGLTVEAESIDAFVEIARDLAPDLVAGHRQGSSIDFRYERELV